MNGEGDILSIYDQICYAIVECSPQFIGSRTHLSKIIYDLCGKKDDPIIKTIDTTRVYIPKPSNRYNKYKKKEYTQEFRYFYEYEDIWFALMNDERFKSIIQKRRFRDVEDMIYHIDERWEEFDESYRLF